MTMSFDEHLRQAFESLNDRLRDDIARQVRAVVDELASTARNERDRAADEAGRTAAEAARAAADDAAKNAADSARAAADAAIADARAAMRSADLTARERLLAAIRTMDRARSLTEIFDALSLGVEREATRHAVLIVRDGGSNDHGNATVRGWRFAGFDASLDRSHDAEIPSGDRGVVDQAIRTMAAASAEKGGAAAPFDLPDGRQRLAVPILIAGSVVAVIYADEGAADGDAKRSDGWEAAVEILARHAARALESLTAFKTARALSERSISAETNPSAGANPSDADQAARRYARLLVSEIKLYHEPDVTAGRRERNLAARLAGEIERARALYEERVPSDVRLRTDFFQAELVRTLADGDASLLEAKS